VTKVQGERQVKQGDKSAESSLPPCWDGSRHIQQWQWSSWWQQWSQERMTRDDSDFRKFLDWQVCSCTRTETIPSLSLLGNCGKDTQSTPWTFTLLWHMMGTALETSVRCRHTRMSFSRIN
jgi:hypothetical protein